MDTWKVFSPFKIIDMPSHPLHCCRGNIRQCLVELGLIVEKKEYLKNTKNVI